MSRVLFEPTGAIEPAAARRRARLISILCLAQGVLTCLVATIMANIARGTLGTTGALLVAIAGVGTLITYFLSRRLNVEAVAWAYLVIQWGAGCFMTWMRVSPEESPFRKLAFLLLAALLTNALMSARATLTCGLVAMGIVTSGIVHHQSGPFPDDDLPAGISFFIMNLLTLVVLGLHRDGLEADRSRELTQRNEELLGLRHTLEERIAARTAELSVRNFEMRLVLDNVAQGIFTMDASGSMSSQHSAVLANWFGPVRPNEAFYRYLGRVSPVFGDQLQAAWAQVLDDILPLELALEQIPRELDVGDRRYRFSFEPIRRSEDVRYLVVVSDVTIDRERELAQREKQELSQVFEQLVADRSGLLSFMAEASLTIERIVSADTARGDLLRAVHTVKGNAMMFGLTSVASLCHILEAKLQSVGAEASEERAQLQKRWLQISASVAQIVGTHRSVIEMSEDEHQALEEVVRCADDRAIILQRVKELRFEAVERRLQHFADQARLIAARLDKRVTVAVSSDRVRLDQRRWAPFWAAFTHAVRNAVDHGIEPPHERAVHQKSEQGNLRLRVTRDVANLCVELEDDGRGIDWDALRQRCAQLGIVASSHEDLLNVLFSGGISTAREVTDLSGRGVGMSALRSSVVELGGHLDVISERGQGTRLRMQFPASVAWSNADATQPLVAI